MSKQNNTKNLSALEMLEIEVRLDQGSPPSEIARAIGRDPSGIRKEIKNFGTYLTQRGSARCVQCVNLSGCTSKFMCDTIRSHQICSLCRGCEKAPMICPEYELFIDCQKLDKIHACNSCDKIKKCPATYRYLGKYAADKHNSLMNMSHRKLKAEDLPRDYLEYIARLIKNGISPDIVMNRLPDIYLPYRLSTPTLYDYIDKGLIPGINNMDLRFKVSRAANGTGSRPDRTPKKHQLNGHSIENIPEEDKSYPLGYVELDTVVGPAGGAVLLTVLIPKYSLMLTRKLKSKTQEEVKRALDELEIKLGEYFYLLFRTVVPDNGTEFTNSAILENSAVVEGKQRFHVYYTHTYSSYEKPHVENMHVLLRWLVQKGADISLLTDTDIERIILTLNNYPRRAKYYMSPIELLLEELGPDVVSLLELKFIPLDQLNISTIIRKGQKRR